MSNLKVYSATDFYTLQQLQEVTLAELHQRPTLEKGLSDDLKIEGMLVRQDGYLIVLNQFRLWLSRTTVEDGEIYNNKVITEIFDNNFNRWTIFEEWEALSK